MSSTAVSPDGMSDKDRRRQERREWRENRRRWDNDYFENRIFGAFYLIIIGVIFLLNTTGVLPWSVWLNIFKFWPLFIVSAGIGIIFAGNRVLKLIGSLIGLGIFLAILFLAIINPFGTGWSLVPTITSAKPRTITNTIARSEYSDLVNRNITADISLGKVTLLDASSSTESYLSTFAKSYSDSEMLSIVKSVENSSLNINLSNTSKNDFNLINQSPEYVFQVGQTDIPTNINLKLGAGDSNINLGSLRLKNFETEVGAGNIEIRFSKTSIPTGNFSIKNGLGNIRLTLPKDSGLIVSYKVGLGNLTLNGAKVVNGSGTGQFLTGTSTNSNSTVLNVEAGLGNIEVVVE